jgi:hypothetical protein
MVTFKHQAHTPKFTIQDPTPCFAKIHNSRPEPVAAFGFGRSDFFFSTERIIEDTALATAHQNSGSNVFGFWV